MKLIFPIKSLMIINIIYCLIIIPTLNSGSNFDKSKKILVSDIEFVNSTNYPKDSTIKKIKRQIYILKGKKAKSLRAKKINKDKLNLIQIYPNKNNISKEEILKIINTLENDIKKYSEKIDKYKKSLMINEKINLEDTTRLNYKLNINYGNNKIENFEKWLAFCPEMIGNEFMKSTKKFKKYIKNQTVTFNDNFIKTIYKKTDKELLNKKISFELCKMQIDKLNIKREFYIKNL